MIRWAILLLAVVSAPVFAGEKVISITDFGGRGFPPDLVTYSVDASNAKKLRVFDADGKPVASQTSVEANAATLSFVAEIAPGGTTKFTVRDDEAGEIPAGVRVEERDGVIEISNALLSVRVPAKTDKTLDVPMESSGVPAPIVSFRSADGPWRGGAKLVSTRKIKRFQCGLASRGPASATAQYQIDFDGGGFYRATVEVIDRVPLVKVREEFDAGAVEKNSGDMRPGWELNLTKGTSPNSVELMRAVGNGGYSSSVVTLTKFKEKPVGAGGGGYAGLGSAKGAPIVRYLVPDSGWGGDLASYIGLFDAAAKPDAQPASPITGFIPLHKGAWRRANALEVCDAPDGLVVRLPMNVEPLSWLREVTSETSPFSMLEHDPSLPLTLGRREWGLQLAPVNLAMKSQHGDTPFYRARAAYGIMSLDRYKDFVLAWPDSKSTYPRVFLRGGDLEKMRASWKSSPFSKALGQSYIASGDEAQAAKTAAALKSALSDATRYMLSSPAMGHHQSYTYIAAMADDVLAWPKMPDDVRADLRARLALITYLYAEPDISSAGNGMHHGNPNMGVSRLSDRTNFMALLPDHPMFKSWLAYFSEWEAYKTGQLTAPGGGWVEFGSAYHMHGFAKVTRGILGLVSAGAPNAAQLIEYAAPNWNYYMNLLTPFEPRYGARIIPGSANSPPGQSENLYEAPAILAEKYPELAAHLTWAWEQSGKPDRGFDSFLALMTRPWIAAKEPKLGSLVVPGVGVIFRAHQGPDETYMYFRSGYDWSHWVEDQGHFVLHAKGAPLVPGQPFQYYWPDNKDFDLFNTVRFGHPANTIDFGWPDSNVLEHAFGPTVDYAWSSSGFPAWYIKPGKSPGFGEPRKLADVAGQKEGAFHWNRQVMFLKGAAAKSPNYFVFRDTTQGEGKLATWFNLNVLGRKADVKMEGNKLAVNTLFPTKLEVVFADRAKVEADMLDAYEPLTAFHPAFAGPQLREAQKQEAPVNANWVRKDGKPATTKNPPDLEQHVIVRVAGAPGGEHFWLLYPRGADEKSPTVSQLAPGAMKIVTSESTDYVFMSPVPFKWSGEDVTFEGCAGAVRVRGDGGVTLVRTGGSGVVGYKKSLFSGDAPLEITLSAADIAAGKSNQLAVKPAEVKVEAVAGGVRFVNSGRGFVQLTQNDFGVRGTGPFDLTMSEDKITGTIEGDIRTVVVTKPKKISRPMYHIDGVLWYAGIPDDPSPRGTGVQFNVALGVMAGSHKIELTEWRWPSLPSPPPRKKLD